MILEIALLNTLDSVYPTIMMLMVVNYSHGNTPLQAVDADRADRADRADEFILGEYILCRKLRRAERVCRRRVISDRKMCRWRIMSATKTTGKSRLNIIFLPRACLACIPRERFANLPRGRRLPRVRIPRERPLPRSGRTKNPPTKNGPPTKNPPTKNGPPTTGNQMRSFPWA